MTGFSERLQHNPDADRNGSSLEGEMDRRIVWTNGELSYWVVSEPDPTPLRCR